MKKPQVLSHSAFSYLVLVGHHCSKRVGDIDHRGMVNLSWAGWVVCKE